MGGAPALACSRWWVAHKAAVPKGMPPVIRAASFYAAHQCQPRAARRMWWGQCSSSSLGSKRANRRSRNISFHGSACSTWGPCKTALPKGPYRTLVAEPISFSNAVEHIVRRPGNCEKRLSAIRLPVRHHARACIPRPRGSFSGTGERPASCNIPPKDALAAICIRASLQAGGTGLCVVPCSIRLARGTRRGCTG